MRPIESWWDEVNGDSRHWLVLGKGPSFDSYNRYDTSSYTTIAINHAVRERPVEAASAVNFDVVGDLGDILYENCRVLLMPRYPHTIAGDAPLPLERYFERFPVLRRLSDENRLVWYNLDSDPIDPASRVVENGPFSVCILFYLLGAMGAKRVRTLGVDGGTSYGKVFARDDSSRLANGMTTYDYQFYHMMRAVKRYGMRYSPLNQHDMRLQLLTKGTLLRLHLRTNPRAAVRRWLGKGG